MLLNALKSESTKLLKCELTLKDCKYRIKEALRNKKSVLKDLLEGVDLKAKEKDLLWIIIEEIVKGMINTQF